MRNSGNPPLESASLDAVVLAGGINTRELYPGYQPGYKALARVHGRPLIRYVLDALRASPAIRRIGVIGSEPELRPVIGPDLPVGPSADHLLGSVLSALSLFPDAPRVLLATGDLAMLRPAVVEDFLRRCAALPTRFAESAFFSVASSGSFTGPFAACGKIRSRFRDVEVVPGNLLLVSTGLLTNETVKARLNALYAGRKSAFASAMAFGLRVGLTYVIGARLLHCVTLARMGEVASHRFGFDILPVVMEYPEVVIDIDETGDYQIAMKVLDPAARK